MNLTAIEQWAQSALDDYNADATKGEPEYPQMAADVLALVKQHRALLAHNDMLVARLRLKEHQMDAIDASMERQK